MCFKIKVSPAMEVFAPVEIHQVLVKLLDGNHKILNFNSPSVPIATLKRRIQTLTSIPSHLQLLVRTNSRILHDHQALILNQLPSNPKTLGRDDPNLQIRETLSHNPGLPDNQLGSDGIDQTGSRKFPVVVHLLLRLRGGKGGFGSLLRGAATKAGQKKTNNFDACRDMSGRRLRHVNAEKKLEEWRAEAEERKLEKMAEEFMKKKAKEARRKGTGGDGADKYVAKYREDSARCMEEVERSVRESVMGMASSKRKSGIEGSESDSKRLKIWLGKRMLADSDSEDVDEDDGEKEEDANEKSVIIDSGNNSDSSKEAEASSGSVTGGKLDAGSLDQGSSESGSEEENRVTDQSLDKSLGECSAYGKGKILNGPVLESIQENRDDKEVNVEVPHEYDSSQEETIVSLQPTISSLKQEVAPAAEVTISNIAEPVQGESVSVNVNNSQDLDKLLNFDDYNSAAELEVLGMERLKSELQARGLKCGGTLQERAARLFLLKTTPIEMLPKKLFAKK